MIKHLWNNFLSQNQCFLQSISGNNPIEMYSNNGKKKKYEKSEKLLFQWRTKILPILAKFMKNFTAIVYIMRRLDPNNILEYLIYNKIIVTCNKYGLI